MVIAQVDSNHSQLRSELECGFGNTPREVQCDACNEKSKRAAARLGFSFEGIFRQSTLYKGCNRDTVGFSILDSGFGTATAEGGFRTLVAAE